MAKGLFEQDTRILEIFRLSPFVEVAIDCKYVDEANKTACRLRARIKKSPKLWANFKVHKRGKLVRLEKVQ